MFAVVIRAQRIIIPLRSPSVTRKPRKKKKEEHRWNLMSKEAGSRWLHVELVLRHDQDQPSTRREIREIRQKGTARGGGGEKGERKDDGGGERQMQVQPAPVQDGRMDVRADEGGIEL